MNNTPHAPVTVIGLGLMGQALAGAFLKAGHPTTVWNRTPAKAAPLVAAGARSAPTLGDALGASPLTIVCLTDYDAVYELLGANGVERDLTTPIDTPLIDTTLINLTSGSAGQAREAAEWAERRGARYLDGAIMAIPSGIGTAEAVILHSGPEKVFAEHASTLGALGTITHLGADPGLASLYDVAGLAMMWSVLNAWLQGTALLAKAGVDAVTYAPFARQIAAGVADWLPGYAEQIDTGSFPAEVAALETDARAMEHLIEESEAMGVNAELPRLIKAMADRAIAAGHGGEQYPVLIEEFGKP
ncbi:NAD-dependent glycerol-3-phosphate dehydrogenase [Streptomyces venezuelae]|uniref:NAD(P)-dependent oxidoreductase n=1 Tax=Streptomyces gardneri TaxID=66892 RepID=UPI0006BD6452|nr:NAD(P)-binding domain-containing protein [Streptomyces gardneri]ALO12790.1 NAD-dependent glycerol-3-phosphate dehydrogenase [Streptomyces venezuelae]QPK49506.1 NAD(P)-dependent oxidoreductase [Streptomyces gardneri]WRK41045.1 NAD(P)-binding domain-containing protein [Streptomyces venezuelae]CUM36559.1 3-hydroxyisobutyrate dehydrogenase [Streptomyces venezuelae]